MILLPSFMQLGTFQIALIAMLLIVLTQGTTANSDNLRLNETTSSPVDYQTNRIHLKYVLLRLVNQTEELIWKLTEPIETEDDVKINNDTKIDRPSETNDDTKMNSRIRELMKELISLEGKMKTLNLDDNDFDEFKLRVTTTEEKLNEFINQFDNEMSGISKKEVDFLKTLMDFGSSVHNLIGKLTEQTDELEGNNEKKEEMETNEDKLVKQIILDTLLQNYKDASRKLVKINHYYKIESITLEYLERYNTYISFLLPLAKQLDKFYYRMAIYNAMCMYVYKHPNSFDKQEIAHMVDEINSEIETYRNANLTCENYDPKLCWELVFFPQATLIELSLRLLTLRNEILSQKHVS